ncbi:hypothetical protein F5H01DRAFT_215254 [Linnemannia elongata]|nr:hypothetical protein F5H01DRAFT_215254 [Linnemannia elongata]
MDFLIASLLLSLPLPHTLLKDPITPSDRHLCCKIPGNDGSTLKGEYPSFTLPFFFPFLPHPLAYNKHDLVRPDRRRTRILLAHNNTIPSLVLCFTSPPYPSSQNRLSRGNWP